MRMKKYRVCMGVEKNGVLRRWSQVELSAYESVRKGSFHCSRRANWLCEIYRKSSTSGVNFDNTKRLL